MLLNMASILQYSSSNSRKRRFLQLFVTILSFHFMGRSFDLLQRYNFLLAVLNSYETVYSLFPRINTEFSTETPMFWEGEDVYKGMCLHSIRFLQTSGETPQTFESMYYLVEQDLNVLPAKLSKRNKLLMTLMWLRTYNTYYSLSVVFKVSITDISRCVNNVWPVLFRVFGAKVSWPTHNEWIQMRQNWPRLEGVVGAIGGTSHVVLVPGSDQHLYFSGHRRYHCVHTQIIIDNCSKIRYIKSGFLGHNNDAYCYGKLPNIGENQELHLPKDCWILADGIYPARPPLLTPYRCNQLMRRNYNDFANRTKFNLELRTHRVYIEHVIGYLKHYKIIGSIYRHDIKNLDRIVLLCASLSQRRLEMFNSV